MIGIHKDEKKPKPFIDNYTPENVGKAKRMQGGILFWLHGNLWVGPDILPETALKKNKDNDKICI